MIFNRKNDEKPDPVETVIHQVGGKLVMNANRQGEYIIAEPTAVVNVGDME